MPKLADPVFKVEVPLSCPGVPAELLDTRSTWSDPEEHARRAARLAEQFAANFESFAGRVSPAVAAAGPQLPA